MTEIDFACAADARYVPHSAVTILSALDHHGGDLRVHYLPGPDVTAEQERRLREMVERKGATVRFLHVDSNRTGDLPSMGYISTTMWNRIFLPELLPEVDRVLYVNADTIVMDSLTPLWKLDLSRHLVGAVTNVFQRFDPGRPEPFELERADPPYFNSGVLLLNLELMRDRDTTDRLLESTRENRGRKGWPDQDALNHVMGETRLALDPRWNVMNSFEVYPWASETFDPEALAAARRRPGIRHFEGPSINKPWHLLCERSNREDYARIRRRTPWPQQLPDGITPSNLVRRARISARRRLRRGGGADDER